VCGEVVQVYSLVGATRCEDDFLALFGNCSRRLRDGEAAYGRLMGIEEECICKLGFIGGRYGCCDAMENSIVGPRDYLDRGGLLELFWCGWLDLFAWYHSSSSGRFAIGVSLSLCHVVEVQGFVVVLMKKVIELLQLFLQGLLAAFHLA
jgi:hypothetical protein